MGLMQYYRTLQFEVLDLDPDYRKVYNYAKSKGIPRPPKEVIFLQNKLVIDLKEIGVFQKWDSFHMGVNGFVNGKGYAQINWVNPTDSNYLNQSFDVVWDMWKGFGGSVTSNAEWRCAYTQINYTLNDACIFCHVNQVTGTGSNIVIRGGIGPSSSDGLIQTDNLAAQRINQGNTNLGGAMNMSGMGHKLLFRVNSNDVIGWNNVSRTARTRATLGLDGAFVVMGRGNTAFVSFGGMGGSFDSLAVEFQARMNQYLDDINSI